MNEMREAWGKKSAMWFMEGKASKEEAFMRRKEEI